MYGFHPSLPAMPEPPYNMQAPADFIDNIHRTVAATRDALLDAQVRQARIADRDRSSAKFVAGQYVYLSTKHLPLDVPHKFKLRYLGPFRIRSVTSSGNACELELPHTLARLHATRNTSELKLAAIRDPSLGTTPFCHPAPQPLADGETYFILDRIIDSRIVRNHTQYRCSYLGYEPAYDEWVPEARLRARPDGPAAIAAYLAATANLPCHAPRSPSPPRPGRARVYPACGVSRSADHAPRPFAGVHHPFPSPPRRNLHASFLSSAVLGPFIALFIRRSHRSLRPAVHGACTRSYPLRPDPSPSPTLQPLVIKRAT